MMRRLVHAQQGLPLRRTAVLLGWIYAIALREARAARVTDFVEETEQDTIFLSSASWWLTILLIVALLAVAACITLAIVNCIQRRARHAEASLRGDGIEKSIKLMTARLYRTRQQAPVDPLLALEAPSRSPSPTASTPPPVQSATSPALDMPTPLPPTTLTRPRIKTDFALPGVLEPCHSTLLQGTDSAVSATFTMPAVRSLRGSPATPGTASQSGFAAANQPNSKLQRENSFAGSAVARSVPRSSSMRVFAGLPKVEAMRRALGGLQLHCSTSPAALQSPALPHHHPQPPQLQQWTAEEAARGRATPSLSPAQSVDVDALAPVPYPCPNSTTASEGLLPHQRPAGVTARAGGAGTRDAAASAAAAASGSRGRAEATAAWPSAAPPRPAALDTAAVAALAHGGGAAGAHGPAPRGEAVTGPLTAGASLTATSSGVLDGVGGGSEAAVPPVLPTRQESAASTRGSGGSHYSHYSHLTEEGEGCDAGTGSHGRFSASRRYRGAGSAGSGSIDLPRVHLAFQRQSSNESPMGGTEFSPCSSPHAGAAAVEPASLTQERLHTSRMRAESPAEHCDPAQAVVMDGAASAPPEEGPDDTAAYWRLLDAQFANLL